MNSNQTIFSDIKVFKSNILYDNRGYFYELFNKSKDNKDLQSIQANVSSSKKNILRGIHFQTGFYSQKKSIHVLEGQVWDVIVDVNICSSTYGFWMGVELNKGENIIIPHGFGHAFLALKDSLVIYQCSAPYNKESERTIIYSDPDLEIDWPIKDKKSLIISQKDSRGIRFKDL